MFWCTICEERMAMPSYFCFAHMYLCATPKLFVVSNSINLWLLIIEEKGGRMAVYIHKILLVGRGNTDTDGVKNVDTLPSQEGWNSPYYADAILLPSIYSALSVLSTQHLKSPKSYEPNQQSTHPRKSATLLTCIGEDNLLFLLSTLMCQPCLAMNNQTYLFLKEKQTLWILILLISKSTSKERKK